MLYNKLKDKKIGDNMICPKCHNDNRYDALTCDFCMAKLPMTKERQLEINKQKKLEIVQSQTGLAAALKAREKAEKVAVLERNDELGGILNLKTSNQEAG